MLDGMSDSIQRSRIENLHSREVDRQSPTGLIFNVFFSKESICACIVDMLYNVTSNFFEAAQNRNDEQKTVDRAEPH